MKRIILSGALLLIVAAFVVVAGGAGSSGSQGTYKIEIDNAFGLVKGAPFKVGGVPAGKVTNIEVCKVDVGAECKNPLHAVVTADISSKGFSQLRSDAYCRTRPESLIGEYFVDCQPGSTGQLLTPGSHNPECNKNYCTIPVTHTQSTIPFDLINNIMRLPYRQRFTLIINELGAAVAGRGGDLQAALKRAVPALTDTDNLLNLLANDSKTLQSLTANSNTVLTELANNKKDVQNFIVEANKAATATANQEGNFRSTLGKLPGFLEQLRPAMAKLDTAARTNTPVLENLNQATGHLGATQVGPDQLRDLFTNIAPCSKPHADSKCGFADASLPALRSLGQASLTGRPALIAAQPTIHHLNQFAKPVPELAQNLSILTQDLDTQKRAVEPDRRSPGGKGFTGLQALLQYAFNQPLAINAYSQFGHLLTVDAFINQYCAPYATPQRIANNLATNPQATRQCYSWLGPNQPGVNERDPSNPGGCVPDPGYSPSGRKPSGTACKLAPNPAKQVAPDTGSGSAGGNGTAVQTGSAGTSSGNGSGLDLQQALGQMFSSLGGSSGNTAAAASAASSSSNSGGASGSGASSDSGSGSGSGSSAGQAKQLLNYLLAP